MPDAPSPNWAPNEFQIAERAMAFSLESFRQNDLPPSSEAIVARAKEFQVFLAS